MRLTDKNTLLTPSSSDLIHVVDVSDTTAHPQGTSKKVPLHALVDLIVETPAALPDGGTVGQVLTKQSSTDGDADWQDPTGGSEWIVVSSSQTAALDAQYSNVASATYTDPTPAEGKGFIVLVRNGTATVGGTAYSTAGTLIYRVFHSGSWANYVYQVSSTFASASHTHAISDVTGLQTALDAKQFKTYVTVGFEDADYICDGTADNVQIQAAIDDVVANGGGIVYIKNGTYSIADSLVLQSNVTVMGDEFSTVLSLANGVNKSVFVNLNTATEVDVKISVQKLTIFGNRTNQTSGTTVNGISFTNVEDFLIADVIISNCAYDGVRLNSCERGDIRDVISSQNTSSGIIVLNGGGDYKISNCTTNTNSDEGIKIAGVSRVQVSNHYSKGNGQDGIKVEEFGGAGSQFISVIGAYLDDNDDGIHIRDGSDNFYFSNIVASNNDKSGILVQDCDNFTVANSILHTNKFNGIGVSGSVNFTITGNAIYNNNQEQLGNDYSGIKVTAYLGRESETGTISGNSIYDNQGTKTQQYGVRSVDSTSKLAVVANSIGTQVVSAISLVGTNTVASNDIPSGELRVENFISRTGAGLTYLNNVNDSFGVGIITPDTKVHIQAASSGASLPLIKAQNNATANGTATEIVLTNTTATGIKHAGIAAVRTNSPSSESTDLVFYNTQTSATRFIEKMRLSATGNLSVIGDVTVADEAYDATAWDGSLEVPTKNAIRDKIESMGGGGYTDEQAQDAVGTILTDTTSIDLIYDDAGNTISAQREALTGAITAPKNSNTTSLGSFTKAQLDTAVSDGNVMYVGDAPTAHTHLLAAGATDVTITAANLNTLDDGADSTLHFHATDRDRANHSGTQLASTISDFATAVAATAAVTANTAKVSNATHTGDVTGATSLTITNDVVTNAKLANVATATIKGRTTAGTGDPEDLTGTQATALLDTFTSGAKGLVPASGGGTTTFLRADGTFATPAGGGGGLTYSQILSIASLRV